VFFYHFLPFCFFVAQKSAANINFIYLSSKHLQNNPCKAAKKKLILTFFSLCFFDAKITVNNEYFSVSLRHIYNKNHAK